MRLGSEVEFSGAQSLSARLIAACWMQEKLRYFNSTIHLQSNYMMRGFVFKNKLMNSFFFKKSRNSKALLLLCVRACGHARARDLSPSMRALLYPPFLVSPPTHTHSLSLHPSVPTSIVVCFGSGAASPLRDDGLVCVFGYLAV